MTTVRQLGSNADRVRIAAEYPHLSALRVFDCFTVPELMALWWAPESEMDARPGGEYHLAWNAMNWHLYGSYSEVVPGSRLAFTWQWNYEQHKPVRYVDITFTPEAYGSSLLLTHGIYAPDDSDERQEHIEGWLHFLALLGENVNE